MKQQALFKALADPTRRQILKRLRRGSATAGDIAADFKMSKPSLSHHFNVLKEAELLRNERRGQHIVYSINTSVFEDAAGLLLDLFGPGTQKVKRGKK